MISPSIPHLYIHVPFCPTICPFCSFHVLHRRHHLVDAYLTRLDHELAATAATWPEAGALRSVYLGGGTPSHLSDTELERLVTSIRRRFDVSPDAEFALEAHPLNVSPARPPHWRELGFNRVSVGVQSTQDPVLRALGRPYDAAAGLAALEAVLAVEGWRVNADLIIAAPGQDVAADLHRLAATGVHHLAAYTLTIEDGTPFQRRGVTVPEEAERAALIAAAEILPAYGLSRYEVSNYARPGAQCHHNLGYWRNHFWFGAGPSATAHLPATPEDPGVPGGHARPDRLVRNPDLNGWLAGVSPGEETLGPDDTARNRLLGGLRLSDGVTLDVLDVLDEACGGDTAERARLRHQVQELCRQGLLIADEKRLRASGEGLLVLDHVLAELW